MQYHNIEPISRPEAEFKFRNGTSEEIRETLIRVVFHEVDRGWAEQQCLNFMNSNDVNTRAVAITCLGHIARIHGELNTDLIVPILTKLLDDSVLGGYASDALEDIELFLNN